ncbi:hypothetical protein BJV77DRAFT_1068401 [Russula vinacea]|nr:hypothetical protein BJV77DRAFT_1068401 [Russula vinacea]
MPHIKPLFRSLPSSIPTINYYDWLLGRPELKSWSDFTLHIDAVTGEQRQARAVLERFEHTATALPRPQEMVVLVCPFRGPPALLNHDGHLVKEYPVLVFALLKLAVPIAFLPSQSTLQETVELLKLSGVTCLFASGQLYPHAAAAAKAIGLPEEGIFILQGDVTGKVSLPSLIENVKARGLSKTATRTVQDDTLAYIMFSSGTTGLPKAIMISHRNMIFSTSQLEGINEEIAKVYPPEDGKIPVHLAVLPWYHAMGAHAFMFRLFIAPSTHFQVIIRSSHNITRRLMRSTFEVPDYALHYGTLHDVPNTSQPELLKIDLSSLAFAVTGAAHLPPELRVAFERRAKNLPFFTEGWILLAIEARILREDGSDADYNEIGELILRGPTIALGYLNNEKATKETFKDGWLYTGDRFYVDRQERFFYVDRRKDTFKVSGKQVSPNEIENAIREHPARLVIDVAVAGVKGERLSSELVPRAWVVLSESGKEQGVEAVLAALDGWARLRLSKHKWLRGGLQVVDEIPRLPTGKILRRKLQDEYARGGERTPMKLLTKL